MSRSDSHLPSQLRVVGATDLERRLLVASARELPSVELTKKMQQALGLSIAAGAATAATAATAKAATAAGAGSAAPAVAWPAISVGVLALAVTGAVVGVGVRSAGTHHAAVRPLAAAVTPLPVAPPPPAAPAALPAAVEVATPITVGAHRTLAAPSRHRAATPGDLRGEIALVDAARTALAGGANERALALLGRYDTTHPHGTFRPEAAALRIEALDHLGRAAQARALAQKFVAAHPESPLAERVARVTGLAGR